MAFKSKGRLETNPRGYNFNSKRSRSNKLLDESLGFKIKIPRDRIFINRL